MVFADDGDGNAVSTPPQWLRRQYAAVAGREMLDASPDGDLYARYRLACKGRRHPAYERVVTRESIRQAHAAAVAAGRTRIGMREITQS